MPVKEMGEMPVGQGENVKLGMLEDGPGVGEAH